MAELHGQANERRARLQGLQDTALQLEVEEIVIIKPGKLIRMLLSEEQAARLLKGLPLTDEKSNIASKKKKASQKDIQKRKDISNLLSNLTQHEVDSMPFKKYFKLFKKTLPRPHK